MKKTKRTLNELLLEKSIILRTEGRIGTANNYRTLKNYIEQRFGTVKMEDVSPKWAVAFNAQMKRDGKSNGTIRGYFALLQAITYYGEYIGATSGDTKLTRSKSYELDKVKLEKPRTRQNKWLSRDEMDMLWEYWVKCEPNSIHNRCHKRQLGIFLASYLCNGCNMADLVRLRYDDEYYTSKGQLFGFVREKVKRSSGVYVRIPITDKLRMIIDEIGDKEERNGYVFGSFIGEDKKDDEEEITKRVMTLNTFCSRIIRVICKDLGLRDDVSFTFARHSYASNLNHAGCNFALIERNLGHVLGGVSDSYIGNAPIQQLFEMNNNLFTC